MNELFKNNIYSLGLLYSYIYGGRKMVRKSDLEGFYNSIMNHLSIYEDEEYNNSYLDTFDTIYYEFNDKFSNSVYCVLKSDCNILEAKNKYIESLSHLVIIAANQKDSLEYLNLTRENARIVENKKRSLKEIYYFIENLTKDINNDNIKVSSINKEEVLRNLEDCLDYLEYDIKREEHYGKTR